MKRLKIAITTLALLASFSVPGMALAIQGQSDACNGLNQLGGTTCSGNPANDSPGQDAIANVAKDVVNIISLIAGIAAVILIVIAGVKFLTSGGDSGAVSSAKNTLVYAIIGLVVVALAQVIVHFVLNAVINNTVSPT